jgi:uncharacterized protein
MDLSQDLPGAHHVIRWVQSDAVSVDDRPVAQSFLLTPQALQEDWGPASVDELDEDALERVLALKPEVLLLGTGGRQRFPAPRVMAFFLSRGIGIEVMDNAGAARTFNLLAGESRRVVAAFLLPR